MSCFFLSFPIRWPGASWTRSVFRRLWHGAVRGVFLDAVSRLAARKSRLTIVKRALVTAQPPRTGQIRKQGENRHTPLSRKAKPLPARRFRALASLPCTVGGTGDPAPRAANPSCLPVLPVQQTTLRIRHSRALPVTSDPLYSPTIKIFPVSPPVPDVLRLETEKTIYRHFPLSSPGAERRSPALARCGAGSVLPDAVGFLRVRQTRTRAPFASFDMWYAGNTNTCGANSHVRPQYTRRLHTFT